MFKKAFLLCSVGLLSLCAQQEDSSLACECGKSHGGGCFNQEQDALACSCGKKHDGGVLLACECEPASSDDAQEA